ncbi:MAG: histone deacetylase, partial [Pseudomonadota bacterium]
QSPAAPNTAAAKANLKTRIRNPLFHAPPYTNPNLRHPPAGSSLPIPDSRPISPPMTAIIHHPDYDAATVGDDHRFPMRKYSIVAELLRAQGYSFETPPHASVIELERAHNPDYVHAVLTSRIDRKLERKIGFPVTPAIAARSRASCGGTLLAARRALDIGTSANLAGGSHHARPETGAGFCVFNDVAIAALALLAEKPNLKIAVLDFDVHHGDGTALIFADNPQVFTTSLHCQDNWPRTKPPSDLDIGLPKGTTDDEYLTAAASALTQTLDRAKPDLLFYNAGVDPHTEDRLGLLDISDSGLKAREHLIADTCREKGLPLSTSLGGGYQKDPAKVAERHTWMVHALTGKLDV